MSSLTTRQRDLLSLLIDADQPLITADIAHQLQLTPRQVNYSLKGVEQWLALRDVSLTVKPGVGVALMMTQEQQLRLSHALHNRASYQLVLSAGQRQQLFAFHLLNVTEPLILYQLQQLAQVSRTTILKDLDTVAEWLAKFRLHMERRPNYGIEIEGNEGQIRKALCALLWGDTPFDDRLWQMTHTSGLVFALDVDAQLLPILEVVQSGAKAFKVRAAIKQVAYAEAELGGRFSDEAVLHLALVLAVQSQRIANGRYLQKQPAQFEWLAQHPIWQTARLILEMQATQPDAFTKRDEIALIAAHLLASARNDRWPADLENERDFVDLIGRFMQTIGSAYALSNLTHDKTLRDGLISHVIPACLRLQFDLWSPPQVANRLSDKYAFEHALAQTLAEMIAQERDALLPPHEINNLALLIRAAYIRERPNKLQKVIVVCPSGMATAQLLTARLTARFPRLGEVEVLSLRELDEERLNSAELIITTIPLDQTTTGNCHVIQVHPLLLPEDIETITQWLD